MLAENQEQSVGETRRAQRGGLWLRAGIGLLLGAIALGLVIRQTSLAEVGAALRGVRPGFVALGLLVILLTIAAKSWRWGLLFYPPSAAPGARPLFAALALGQFVNIVVPFFRLGEVARIYAVRRETSKALALGTLVVEKTLDLLILVLTVLVVLPVVTLPDLIDQRGVASLAVITLVALLLLYLVAYQTRRVIGFVQLVARRLPAPLQERVMHLATAGLGGLAALRSHRRTAALLGASLIIGVLSILTPLVLFPAFGLPLGWAEAALIHLAVTIGSVPPSTPAKIGVFEWLTVLVLARVGVGDASIAVAYALLFHLVVIVPPLLLGIWAAAERQWPGPAATP